MEVVELELLQKTAERKDEARQIAVEVDEQITGLHFDKGLTKWAEAAKLDPDSDSWRGVVLLRWKRQLRSRQHTFLTRTLKS